MNDFSAAFRFIVWELEGGDKVHRVPGDPGGLTKFGISQRAYPDLDVEGLREIDASEIYLRDYWQPCRCDALPWVFALPLFDGAVNQGVRTAGRLFQEAVGVPRQDRDGIIGSQSLAIAGGVAPALRNEVMAAYMALRAMRYAGHDEFARFGRGWMIRLFKVYGRAVNG